MERYDSMFNINLLFLFFFFQAEDGIRDYKVTGVQTSALPISMQGYFPLMRYSPTLRFTVFGAMSYTVFSVVGVLISLRSVARYVSFTQASIAYSHLGLYAFFTMVIFGSMYYIVPRLVGREWRYASLIKLHFWASAYGIGLMTLMLLAGGFLQGADMQNPTLAFN